MKRIGRYTAVLAAIVAGLLTMTGCDDEERISYGKLPSAARAFIETYFPAESCTYAERDRADGRREYKAVLSNGTEIDFHATGDWKKVECEYSFVPAGIVPQTITEDLARRFPGGRITEAERETGGYKITTEGGAKAVYSSNGTFIRVEYD